MAWELSGEVAAGPGIKLPGWGRGGGGGVPPDLGESFNPVEPPRFHLPNGNMGTCREDGVRSLAEFLGRDEAFPPWSVRLSVWAPAPQLTY